MALRGSDVSQVCGAARGPPYFTAVDPEIPSALAAALADRYELGGVLGKGGMATVYLARDRKHQRDVALKVLQPTVAVSIGSERFLKEIEILAKLNHPNILALYDSGEAAGFVYYVMPCVTGGSLRRQLEETRWLDATRTVAVTAAVADALTYAHEMGVLHRDIKPENILFSHAHPIVADFGIAKAVSAASAPQFTRTGLALGTPGYMSPEQAAGFTDLDARTDVYSLAVVTYEMMVGVIPGRWPTEDELRAGRFLDAPPVHRARLGIAGSVIERALLRALAVRPDQRTPSPAAFVDELRGAAASRRKFNADEVNAIVKRASELEAAAPTGTMTIGGVEAIAAGVGIAPELIRSAAGDLTARDGPRSVAPLEPPRRNVFAGGPTRIFHERVIEGELDERDFPVVVDEIRRLMENPGQVAQFGKSFSWVLVRGTGNREAEVAVSVRAGFTRISCSENLRQLVGACFGGIMGGMGGGGMGLLGALIGGALHMPGLLAVAIPAWFATSFLVARTVYGRNASSRDQRALQLVDRLDALVRTLVSVGTSHPHG